MLKKPLKINNILERSLHLHRNIFTLIASMFKQLIKNKKDEGRAQKV